MKEKVEEGEKIHIEYFKTDIQRNLPLHINHACLHAWQEYASQLCLWLVIFTEDQAGTNLPFCLSRPHHVIAITEVFT